MEYAAEFRLLADRFILRATSPRLAEDAKQDCGVLVASAVRAGLLPELDFIRKECETLGDERDPPLLEFKAAFICTTALFVMSDRVNPLAVRWGGRSDGVLFGTTDANSWESQKETAIAFCRLMSERFEQSVTPVVVAVDPVAKDGLCSSSRVLTWGGVRYSLTPNQMAAVKVLHDAYSKGRPDVGLAEIKERCDSAALNESFAKVFQVKRNGEKSYNPVWNDAIDSLSQGTYRLKDPKKV